MRTDALRGSDAALHAIATAADGDLTSQELLEEAARQLDRVVPAEAWFLAAADPDTSLVTGSGFVTGMPHALCQPIWDHEFLVPDYNKFADLVGAARPVADLHAATGGRPQRSARHRELHAIAGFDAEMRAAFVDGGAAWGFLQANRGEDRFTEPELDWVARAAPLLGRGLRRALLSEAGTTAERRGPGILVLADDGRLVSVTEEAERWLDDVRTTMTVEDPSGMHLPIEAHIVALAARGGDAASARARIRSRSGVWLLLHGSVMRDPSGEVVQSAVVIEPAKASDVAPLIVEAYGLTQREVDVTRLIARGLKTADIAQRLYLSPHTVRDHVKAIFEKVGVSSRGELVAKVFADHYHDGLQEAVLEADERAAAL